MGLFSGITDLVGGLFKSPQQQVASPYSENVVEDRTGNKVNTSSLVDNSLLAGLGKLVKGYNPGDGSIGNDASGVLKNLLSQIQNDQNPAGYAADRSLITQDFNRTLNDNIHRGIGQGRYGDNQQRAFSRGSDNLGKNLLNAFDKNLNASRAQSGLFAQTFANLRGQEASAPLDYAGKIAQLLPVFPQTNIDQTDDYLNRNTKGKKTETHFGKSPGEIIAGVAASFAGA